MKKKQIKQVLNGLKKIRMQKVEDKDLRDQLIKDHIYLLGQSKKHESDLEDLREAHLGPYHDELWKVQEMQFKMQNEPDEKKRKEMIDEINSKTELLDAINAFNKAVEDKGNEEITVDPIDGEKFGVAYAEGQDYDATVVEDISPLFA